MVNNVGKIRISVIVFFLVSGSAGAISSDQWSKTFGGEESDGAYSVQQTSDSGYIIAGWTCSYSISCSGWLFKTDANGSIDWSKTFGGAKDDGIYAVQQTSDGGYILAGYTYSYGIGNSNAWLIKTDLRGNEEWNKTFGKRGDFWAYFVQQTVDGGYILAGDTVSWAGDGNALLIKVDAKGNVQWNKIFGGNYSIGPPRSVQQTSDGGYIFAAGTKSNEGWIIKTDSDGNEQWNRALHGKESSWSYLVYSVKQTSGGGYIIAGTVLVPFTDTHGDANAWIIKTNSNGSIEWNKTFGGNAYDTAYSVQQTGDLGYIIAGYTSSYGAGDEDMWIIKTDAKGEEQWNRTFGGKRDEIAYSVQQTSEGGYILAGSTASFGAGYRGYSDALLVKVGSTGEIGAIRSEKVTSGFEILESIFLIIASSLLISKRIL